MGDRPDWLVPGAEVAVLRIVGGMGQDSVKFTTIERVLKRDVVWQPRPFGDFVRLVREGEGR